MFLIEYQDLLGMKKSPNSAHLRPLMWLVSLQLKLTIYTLSDVQCTSISFLAGLQNRSKFQWRVTTRSQDIDLTLRTLIGPVIPVFSSFGKVVNSRVYTGLLVFFSRSAYFRCGRGVIVRLEESLGYVKATLDDLS